jgi:hypothetical protein
MCIQTPNSRMLITIAAEKFHTELEDCARVPKAFNRKKKGKLRKKFLYDSSAWKQRGFRIIVVENIIRSNQWQCSDVRRGKRATEQRIYSRIVDFLDLYSEQTKNSFAFSEETQLNITDFESRRYASFIIRIATELETGKREPNQLLMS